MPSSSHYEKHHINITSIPHFKKLVFNSLAFNKLQSLTFNVFLFQFWKVSSYLWHTEKSVLCGEGARGRGRDQICNICNTVCNVGLFIYFRTMRIYIGHRWDRFLASPYRTWVTSVRLSFLICKMAIIMHLS